MPALVLHGEADPLVRPAGGRATAAAIPGARLVSYPGMGHDLPVALRPAVADEIALIARRSWAPPRCRRHSDATENRHVCQGAGCATSAAPSGAGAGGPWIGRRRMRRRRERSRSCIRSAASCSDSPTAWT